MFSQLTFLGTGDAMGVPRVYCGCMNCSEARQTGFNERLRSSVLIESVGEPMFMIDCGPDWRKQMEQFKRRDIDHILVTHAHFDHIAGLPEWADACRWLGKQGHVYAPTEVIAVLQRQFPWLNKHLMYHEADKPFTLGGWFIETWRVNHGKNGYAYAYRFSKDNKRWAYCPDAIDLHEEQKKPLFGLDLLIMGTSFYKEPFEFHTRSVYDMHEAMAIIKEVNVRRVYFTHMSHEVDIHAAYPLLEQITLAKTGMKVPLW